MAEVLGLVPSEPEHLADGEGGRRDAAAAACPFVAAEAVDHLEQAGLSSVVWNAVTPNPKDHEVEAAYARYAETDSDVIIGVATEAPFEVEDVDDVCLVLEELAGLRRGY